MTDLLDKGYTFLTFKPSGSPRKEHWLGIITLAYVFLACFYSLTVPIFEAPDEIGHFYFIVQVLKTGALPDQRENNQGENHQPPLYYIIAALPASFADLSDQTGNYFLNRNTLWGQGNPALDVSKSRHGTAQTFPYRGETLALHLARLASIALGAAGVIVTAKLGWQIFPGSTHIGLLAAAWVAFNPQFLFVNSVVNNDTLLILATLGATLQMARIIQHPDQERSWWHLGVWLAIATLAKSTGAAILAVAGLLLIVDTLRRRSGTDFARRLLALVGPIILLAGWWFVRNQLLYGDPLGWAVYKQQWFAQANSRPAPLTWTDIGEFFRIQFHSFWGVFGWMNIWAPGWFFIIILIFCLLGFIGLVAFILGGRFRKLDGFQNASIVMLTITILSQEILMLYLITDCNASCYQGRYLFPAIGALMVLLAFGLVNLAPKRLALYLSLIPIIFLSGAAIYMPLKVINPAYAIPVLPKWRLPSIPNKTNVNFGDVLALKGYALKVTENKSKVDLTVYWQALHTLDTDYLVSIRVMDGFGQPILIRERIPGKKDHFPPSFWLAEDLIADQILFSFPQEPAPGNYKIRLEVLDPITKQALPSLSPGGIQDSFTIPIAIPGS